jgi:hypothetical protein
MGARVASSSSTRKRTMEFGVRTPNDVRKNYASATAAFDLTSVVRYRHVRVRSFVYYLGGKVVWIDNRFGAGKIL